MLARLDPDLMERLPDTGSSPAEIVVQASHRNPYDHLVRASGRAPGRVRRRERRATVAEMAAAIGPATAGAFYHGRRRRDGLSIEASSPPPTRTACRSSSTRR